MLQLATTTAPTRKRRSRLDDAPFIAALAFAEVRDAPTIGRHMLANGTPATLAAIKKRMAEFVRYTGAVEAIGQGWRLVAANDDTPPPPAPTPVSAPVNRKARRAETVEAVPANDNPATVLPIGLHHGCGLELLRSLPDASIDLVLCDLPYGVTKHGFDKPIDTDVWMREMARVVTRRGSIVAFAGLDFTRQLLQAGNAIAPNFAKDRIVWAKTNATGQHYSAICRPMKTS